MGTPYTYSRFDPKIDMPKSKMNPVRLNWELSAINMYGLAFNYTHNIVATYSQTTKLAKDSWQSCKFKVKMLGVP